MGKEGNQNNNQTLQVPYGLIIKKKDGLGTIVKKLAEICEESIENQNNLTDEVLTEIISKKINDALTKVRGEILHIFVMQFDAGEQGCSHGYAGTVLVDTRIVQF